MDGPHEVIDVMDYKIFISHTHRDSDLAMDLARRLEEAGVKVFPVEKSAVNGESVITTVNPGLREADEVIVIVTHSSVNSPGLNSQMGAALAREKRLTPIVVGIEEDELPPFISKYEYVRYADLHAYIPVVARRRPQTAEQQLIQAMQLVFERNGNRGWALDMEDSLWELTKKLPDKEAVKRMLAPWYDLSLEDVEELKELSDKAGGWAHARNGKPVFVDRKAWEEIHDPANRLPRYLARPGDEEGFREPNRKANRRLA